MQLCEPQQQTDATDHECGCADHWLQDKDKGKYVSLKAQMQNEQQEFLRVLRSKAFADPTRYPGCHEQAAYQIEVMPASSRVLHSIFYSP